MNQRGVQSLLNCRQTALCRLNVAPVETTLAGQEQEPQFCACILYYLVSNTVSHIKHRGYMYMLCRTWSYHVGQLAKHTTACTHVVLARGSSTRGNLKGITMQRPAVRLKHNKDWQGVPKPRDTQFATAGQVAACTTTDTCNFSCEQGGEFSCIKDSTEVCPT